MDKLASKAPSSLPLASWLGVLMLWAGACNQSQGNSGLVTQANSAKQPVDPIAVAGAPAAVQADPAAAPPAAPAPPPKVTTPDTGSVFAGTNWTEQQLLAALTADPLSAFRPVGARSTVFRVDLRTPPLRAAFKAATHERPFAAIAEVAAYRLSRCLGMNNVPVAVLRRVAKRGMRHAFDPQFAHQFRELAPRLLVDTHGRVEGAVIYWIEGLEPLAIAEPEARARTLQALRIREPMPAADSLAAQLSSVLAFDYLIGNWDRFSGGNLKGDPSGRVLYARDHDVAFAARINEGLQRRMLEPIVATERFSRTFVERLRALSPESFQRELTQDPGFAEHARLGPASVRGVFDRRGALLSHIGALIEQYGEASVLAFP